LAQLVRLPAELVPKLPQPVRKVLRGTVRTYGRATSSLRPLPDFLILGAQKAGTTALYAYLRWHPEITGPSFKEVSFFDRHYARGSPWYRAHLPARPRQWPAKLRHGSWPSVGEASPSYLFHPLAPKRVRGLIPAARLIAVLRNPVDRALSHYQHEVALGREPLSFEEALEQEEVRMCGEVERMTANPAYFSHAWWNYTYAARGRYAEQLERWYEAFPREQLLVLFSEELLEQPAESYARVVDFLGVGPHELRSFPRIFSREYEQMSQATRERLEVEFLEPNRQLEQLLGRDLPWW
jgi:Sulfotransferase domain